MAPASEVEGVIHSLYTRQFYLQVIIGLVVLSGTIVMLNFRYEQQFSDSLEQEVDRQKEQLQKSEARYQGLVENAADLIYTVDENGSILSINRYAATFSRKALKPSAFARPEVKVNPQDFIGRNSHDIFAKKSADFHLEWIREVKETGRVQSKRHRVTIGEQEFWFSTSIVGLKTSKARYLRLSRSSPGTSPAARPSRTG